MKTKNEWIARLSIVSALYVVLTLLSYPFSYGTLQFRFAEALMLLCFYDRKYAYALTVGCLLANIFSSVTLLDTIFGTLATLLSGLIMSLFKHIIKRITISRFVASFIPVIINSIIVGLMITLTIDVPFLISFSGVALGEFVCVVILGNIVFIALERVINKPIY